MVAKIDQPLNAKSLNPGDGKLYSIKNRGTCLPFALGVFVVTLLKMLTRTRKRVMSRAIRPGITSGGTTKLIQETTTNSPEGRKKEGANKIYDGHFMKYGPFCYYHCCCS